MNETRDIRLKVNKYTVILACISIIVSVFAFENYLSIVYGIIFGTLIAMLNFTLLAKTLEKAVHLPAEKAKAYATSRYFIRFLIYGMVVYISVVANYIHVLGTVFGILSVKMIIFFIYLLNDKALYKHIFKKK